MPVPLARWAFSRRSSGSSTVILRTFAIIQSYTILHTSIIYGIPGESNSIKRIKPVKEIPLFREHNPDRGPLLILLRFDAHNVAAQAQRAVGRAVDAGIVEHDL